MTQLEDQITASSPLKGPLKVLILDKLPQSAIDHFTNKNYQLEYHYEALSESQLLSLIYEYQIVCITPKNTQKITEDILKSAHRLLAIGVFGKINDEMVDLKCATELGISVFSAEFQEQRSVAELLVSFIILLARKTGDASRNIHQGNWQKVATGCHEVRGKILGILGYSSLGTELGIMAEALSMRVVYYDQASVMPHGRAECIADFKEFLGITDFLVVNAPKYSGVIVGDSEMKILKKGAWVLNAGGHDGIDIKALIASLKSSHIAGAALDVLPSSLTQPLYAELQALPNVILTPTIGEHTHEAMERVGYAVSHSLVDYVHDGNTVGSVNFPNICVWRKQAKMVKRVVNVHKNVRGVLREIDNILSSFNVVKQVLETHNGIGYIVVDIETKEGDDHHKVVCDLAELASSIRSRVL